VLGRCCGEDFVVFGATRAGRHAPVPGVESIIGLLINTVPFPVHVPPAAGLLPWLSSLRSEWIAMREVEHTPLIKIREWSQIPSDQPLFESLLVFENYELNTFMQTQGERWKNREFYLLGTTPYPLTVAGYLGANLSLEVTFDQHCFDEDTIIRILDHVQTLLIEMIRDPNRRLSDLPLLSSAEVHQVVVDWNATERDYPAQKCIHQLFEDQARRSPQAVALIVDGRQLTYRALNRHANRLAHYIRNLGLGPDDLVAICMDRSLDMVIGLLGILKAGAAYVPLDPGYPKRRLQFMLEDTAATVVVTDSASLKSLPPTCARLICLDQDREEIAKQPEIDPGNRTTADNLAYVVYTSGSTGAPKGVAVHHRGVVRLLVGVDYVQLDSTRTILHAAPVSFDAATFEIWGALLHGGRCVLYPGKVPGPHDLGEVLKTHNVDTLWLTTALFNTVITEDPQALSGIKQLLIGGEALSAPHVRKGLALLPDTEITNGYGPTESTTFACCHRIPREITEGITSIPIGRPIGNTQAYILDRRLAPMPIGIIGELYIGGDGLARGYLNSPQLTAENFIANPFSSKGGERLYRTGDRARYMPNGTIEFLGRIDNQLKIRGHRIEPGEITAVLREHAAVKEAVVIARDEHPADRRLVAYAVLEQPLAASPQELRTFLKERLPDYMVPSVFVFLESLPLTPNGKVDKKALPTPDQGRSELEQGYSAPRTPTEKLLTEIWADVLKIDQVGIHDNFFDLGGHSLLATQVISRVYKSFHIELPVRTLFETATLSSFAAAIEAAVKSCDQSLSPVIRPRPRQLQRLDFS